MFTPLRPNSPEATMIPISETRPVIVPQNTGVSDISSSVPHPVHGHASRQHLTQIFDAQKKTDQIKVKSLVAAIKEETGSLSARKPSQRLADLKKESPSFRNQVLLRLAESHAYTLLSRISELHLKFDQSDLSLRKKIVKTIAENGPPFSTTLLLHIGQFKFNDMDLPFLAEIGRLAHIRNGLTLFVKNLREQSNPLEFPDDIKKEFLLEAAKTEPFKLGDYRWGKKNYGEEAATDACKSVLGVNNIFRSSVFPAPGYIRKTLDTIAERKPEHHEKAQNWLSFCTLALHGKVSTTQEPAVEKLLIVLHHNENDQLRYHYAQILGKILSRGDTANLFISSLPLFSDPRLLIIVMGSLRESDNPQLSNLIQRLASIAGKSHPCALENHNNFNACLQIAQDKLIPVEAKYRLLNMCISDDIDANAADILGNIHQLGKIFDEIGAASGSYVGQALISWLPHCQNLRDLQGAAKHDSEFVKKMAVFLLKDGFYSIKSYLRTVGEKHLTHFSELQFDETTLSSDEVSSCIAKAREEAIRSGDGKTILNVLEGAIELQPELLTENLSRLQGRHPLIAENMPKVDEDSDDESEDDIPEDPALTNKRDLAWIAAFTLTDTSPTAEQSEKIDAMLKVIFDLPAPEVSKSLMLGLGHVMRHPQYFQNFQALFDTQRKPHMQPLLLPLATLCTHDSELGQTLLKVFKKEEFKDSRRLTPALLALNKLAFDPALSGERREQLLQMCVGDGQDKDHTLMLGLSFVQCLSQMATLDSDVGIRCTQQLQHATTINEIRDTVKREMRNIFPLTEAEGEQFAERLEHYLSTSRRPTALLSYITSLSAGLSGEEYQAVLNELTTFVRTAILPKNHVAFRTERYDILKSTHLAEFAVSAPTALENWKAKAVLPPSKQPMVTSDRNAVHMINLHDYLKTRFSDENHVDPGRYPRVREVLEGKNSALDALQQVKTNEGADNPDAKEEAEFLAILASNDPAEQARLLGSLAKKIKHVVFKRDLRDLKSLIAPPATTKTPATFSVVDSDDPEDLLLAGTEIMGSCQSIYGSAHLNKALMGYVLDGKYRLLAVKDESGRIIARRMMRLMGNPDHPDGLRPVIQLERLYANLGVPQAAIDEMMTLVDHKASLMGGVDVMSCENDLPLHGEAHILESKCSERPNEYVDANNGLESMGEFTIAGAKLVSFATSI